MSVAERCFPADPYLISSVIRQYQYSYITPWDLKKALKYKITRNSLDSSGCLLIFIHQVDTDCASLSSICSPGFHHIDDFSLPVLNVPTSNSAVPVPPSAPTCILLICRPLIFYSFHAGFFFSPPLLCPSVSFLYFPLLLRPRFDL